MAQLSFGDAQYGGKTKRTKREIYLAEVDAVVPWGPLVALIEILDRVNAHLSHKGQVRARGEHPFRVVKRQLGYNKTRFRGLAKNTAQFVTLFALANLYRFRKRLMALAGVVRPQLQ
jgi:IS5 family transposase